MRILRERKVRPGTTHRGGIAGTTLGVVALAAFATASTSPPAVATTEPAASPVPLSSTPADGATGVRTEIPVTVTASAAERLASVAVAGPDGKALPGSLDPTGATWTASGPLKSKTRYTIAATGVAPDGSAVTRQSSFTTFTPPTDKLLKYQITGPQDGDTVGIGMPVMVQFTRPVTDKAAVERALQVVSNPPQIGHWSWLSDERLDWRPQHYWSAGTRVTVHLALDGVPAGAGKYGPGDSSFAFTVGREQVSIVDLAKHQLTVFHGTQAVETLPVTGGKPGADTWGGTMAVIDKSYSVHMQSSTVGFGNEYDIPDVRYAIHLTYSGTYIHAAPWSVGSQGYANVSHGCVGMSMGRAAWFFSNTLPGDIVQVVNSPKNLAPGNGYGDWQDSWTQWVAGSAIKS
jgi:lipoprotein-anchoring transpeptidase ErfK/SrfK